MKNLLASLFVLAFVVSTGCDKQGTPGGPAAKDAKKPIVGQADETFTMDVPSLSTKLKQGESKVVTIALKRGKNFDEDVTLKFSGVPTGVTIEPSTLAIKHGDKDASATIKASDSAAIGDFTIKVTGNPTKGSEAANEFKVTIDKK